MEWNVSGKFILQYKFLVEKSGKKKKALWKQIALETVLPGSHDVRSKS